MKPSLVFGRSLVGASAIVGLGLLVGRVSGLVRDLGLVSKLGVTRVTDVAVFTLSVPDLLTTILIGGAASAVLIPEMHRREQELGPGASARLVRESVVIVGILSAMLALIFALAGTWAVRILAPGFPKEDIGLATTLFQISLIGFPLAAVTAVCAAPLQAKENFTIPAFGTLIYNSALIVAIWGFLAPDWLISLAWGVVAAATIRLIFHLGEVWRVGSFHGGAQGWFPPPAWNSALAMRYLETLGAISLTSLNPVVARAIASELPGGMASVHYAQRLMELAAGLFVMVLSTVLFPRLAAVASDRSALESLAKRGTTVLLLGTLPLTGWFLACAAPAVSVLVEYGRVTAEESERIARLASIAMLGLPAVGLTALATNFYHANRESRFPFRTSVVIMFGHVAFAWIAFRQMGEIGLLTAGVVAAWVQGLILLSRLHAYNKVWLWDTSTVTDLTSISMLALAVGALTWMVVQSNLSPWIVVPVSSTLTLIMVALVLRFGLRSFRPSAVPITKHVNGILT